MSNNYIEGVGCFLLYHRSLSLSLSLFLSFLFLFLPVAGVKLLPFASPSIFDSRKDNKKTHANELLKRLIYV